MAEPRLLKIDRVKVADIVTASRLRPVSEAGVESLLASIAEIGVRKDAVHVRQKKSGPLVLIAGGHRLEAARRLGWDEIEAKVWTDVTDDWARLMEIDDNIAGAELNPLDTALFLAERKRIYEKLHPETAAGAFKGNRHTGSLAADTMSVSSFATATAEKFGMTDRHVRRLIAAGDRLDPRDVSLLRKAPRQVTLRDLAEIAKIGGPTERYEVVEALAEGRAKSAAEARQKWKAEQGGTPVPKDPADEQFIALMKLWQRSGARARRRFLDEVSGPEATEE